MLLFAGLLVAIALLALPWLEPRLVFLPARGPVGSGPGERVELATADGVKLLAWWLPRTGSDGAVLYLHGNAGNLRGRANVVRELAATTGLSVLALDYRGYGESEGRPSEEGMYRDARAGWDWLAARIAPQRIVVWGESLGGAAATSVAREVQADGVPRALVLQSAFTRIPDMATRVIPIPGIGALCRLRMDNLERVREIRCWKLFVHSRIDEVVPFEMGERLFEAACEPKQALWIDHVGHNDAWYRNWFPGELVSALARMP